MLGFRVCLVTIGFVDIPATWLELTLRRSLTQRLCLGIVNCVYPVYQKRLRLWNHSRRYMLDTFAQTRSRRQRCCTVGAMRWTIEQVATRGLLSGSRYCAGFERSRRRRLARYLYRELCRSRHGLRMTGTACCNYLHQAAECLKCW